MKLGANWSSGAEFRPPPGWEGFGGRGGRRTYRAKGARGEDFEFEFGGTGLAISSSRFSGRAPGGVAPARRLWRLSGLSGRRTRVERGQDIEEISSSRSKKPRAVRFAQFRFAGASCDHCGGTGQRAGHVCTFAAGADR
jgi:hypothetical protein